MSQATHRRETRRYILLPFAAALLLVVACVVVVLLFRRGVQVSLVADLMVLVLMLCPAVICLLPVTLLMVMAVFGMNQAHDALAKPLKRVEDVTVMMAERTAASANVVNQKTIDTSARLGFVLRVLNVFEPTRKGTDDE